MNDITVQHISSEQKFVCRFDGHEAVLLYRLSSKMDVKEVDFYSTFVPPEFRGKGIAEKLVRNGLAWAKQEGYKISASCWYAAKFLK